MKRITSKIGWLSAMLVLLLLAAPMTALADGGGEEALTQTSNGYQVTLVFAEPVAGGENSMHIQVLDVHGQPVSNALVEVAVLAVEDEHSETESEAEHTESTVTEADAHGMESPSEPTATSAPENDMGSMESMSETEPAETSEHGEMEMTAFDAGHEAGEYEGEVKIPGAGEWNIRVHVTVDDHLLEFDFLVHVAGAQSTGKNILLGFFAINAVILGTAFTMKFKPAAA